MGLKIAMKSELIEVISKHEYGLNKKGLYLRFQNPEEAFSISDLFFDDLVETAVNFKHPVEIFCGSRKILEINEYMRVLNNTEKDMADLIYYSGTEGIPPELHELSRRLFDIDGSAGMVRMLDGKQLILNDQANCTLQVASLTDATNWCRSEYYHPADLESFLQRCQQQLEANNPQSVLENTYRSFEPTMGINSEEGWLEITSRYTLHEVNGEYFQIGQNIEFRDIPRPADLRV